MSAALGEGNEITKLHNGPCASKIENFFTKHYFDMDIVAHITFPFDYQTGLICFKFLIHTSIN